MTSPCRSHRRRVHQKPVSVYLPEPPRFSLPHLFPLMHLLDLFFTILGAPRLLRCVDHRPPPWKLLRRAIAAAPRNVCRPREVHQVHLDDAHLQVHIPRPFSLPRRFRRDHTAAAPLEQGARRAAARPSRPAFPWTPASLPRRAGLAGGFCQRRSPSLPINATPASRRPASGDLGKFS